MAYELNIGFETPVSDTYTKLLIDLLGFKKPMFTLGCPKKIVPFPSSPRLVSPPMMRMPQGGGFTLRSHNCASVGPGVGCRFVNGEPTTNK